MGYVWDVTKTIIAPLAGALLGYLISQLKKVKADKKRQEDEQDANTAAIKQGIMILLRYHLRDAYYHYTQQGYCSIKDRQEIEEIYDVYSRQMGGNHTGTDYYNAIMALPMCPPKT